MSTLSSDNTEEQNINVHINAEFEKDSFDTNHSGNFEVSHGYDYMGDSFISKVAYWVVRVLVLSIVVWFDRLAFGLKINGKENIDKVRKKGIIIIMNHIHPLDCTFVDLAMVPQKMHYVTLESNFRVPLAKFFVKSLGGVPIPTKIHLLPEFYSSVSDGIKKGNAVCIYPEGKLRPYHDGIDRFNSGFVTIAKMSDSPILPVVVTFRKPSGLYKIYKRKPCITLNVLDPVEISDETESSSLICKRIHDLFAQNYNDLSQSK